MVNIYECNCRQLFGQYCYGNVAQANMMYNLYLYRLTTCYLQIFVKAVVLATSWTHSGRSWEGQTTVCTVSATYDVTHNLI